MKRIILSLLTIVLVSTTAVGATRAYFTDIARSNNNTISTGSFDVNLGGTLPFAASGIAPGDSLEPKYLEVRNNGSLDMLFRAYVESTQNPAADAGKTMADYLNVTVTLNPSDYSLPAGYTAYGPVGQTIYTGTLAGLLGKEKALDNINAAFVDHWPLKPKYVAVYKIDVVFSSSASNELKGKTFSGNIVVEGTQFAHQAEGDIVW